ncbi:MAG: Pvc16 family protein [Planctomycetota bacterium]
MFQDVDSTLKTLMDAAILLADDDEDDGRADVFVDFDVPKEDYPPQGRGRCINFYLYETAENRELRDPAPIIEKVGDRYRRKRPPVRVDCNYMVTAWSKGGQSNLSKVGEEHAILGNALEWLSRFPLIPERVQDYTGKVVEVLQGRLRVAPFPHPTMVAQPGNNGKSLGEFWSALEVPPRPSFNLIVTVALDPDSGQPEGPPVVSKGMRDSTLDPDTNRPIPGSGSEMFWQIGGAVRAAQADDQATQIPIANAMVQMPELSLSTRTDEKGAFSFGVRRRGTFQVDIEADNYMARAVQVSVPSDSTDLQNIELELNDDAKRIAGTVVDVDDPEIRLAGIVVKLKREGTEFQASSTTNIDGGFSLAANHSGEMTISFEKEEEEEGYQNKIMDITVPGNVDSLDIRLKKKPSISRLPDRSLGD